MNATIKNIKLILASCAIFCSCSDNVLEQHILSSSSIKEITFSTKPFLSGNDSRTTFDIENDNVREYWNSTDTIGVFPLNGAQSYFPMINGDDLTSATFTGGGWALLQSTKYAAYFPFNFENRYVNLIGISYIGQSQTKNASTDHLGKYDYMAASLTIPQNDNTVSFEMEHLGSLLSLEVQVPKGSYKSIKLIADSAFAIKSTLDLSKSTPIVSHSVLEDSVILDLNEVVIEKDGGLLNAYMFIPPTNFSSEKLILKTTNTSGVELLYNLSPKKFEKSKYYNLKASSYAISEESVKWSLDNLKDTLQIALKNMVTQESGIQGYGGEPGFMIVRDIMADDVTWQTNTWYKAAHLGWQCNLNGGNNYNAKYWEYYYNRIREANRLLEYLKDIEPFVTDGTEDSFNQIKGESLCIRAWAHFNLVQLYAKRYISGIVNSQDGVPYRESSADCELARHSVEETYAKINADLDKACELLDGIEVEDINHYSDEVAWGLKARVALTMQDYNKASSSAEKAIKLKEANGGALMQNEQLYHGFSNISWETNEGMHADLREDHETVFFYSFNAYMSWNFTSTAVRQGVKCINADTYDTMSKTDLRRAWWDPTGTMDVPLSTFVKNEYQNRKFTARETYNPVGDVSFMRLAEMYLIQAEALVRSGQDAKAQEVFTKFQITRDPSYVSKGNKGDDLAEEIMNSRRIELWGEGFRFPDLKRLHLPIKRGRNFDITFCTFLEKDADAKGWVWEIPNIELEKNLLCRPNHHQ